MPRPSGFLSQKERLELGDFLRRLRGDQSIREVAARLAGENVDKADVNRGRIRRYESGEVLPTVSTTCRLAEIYGVSAISLLQKAGHVVELLRPIVMLLQGGRTARQPLLRQAGVLFALYAFRRRGDSISLAGVLAQADLDEAFAGIAQDSELPGRLPHAIALAKRALTDSALDVDSRCFIAAEYVHAYLRAAEPQLYPRACRRIYSQE